MRYFLELSYKGTRYSGFQVQENAHTVQAELEKAMALLVKMPVALTGSSRTDAGVHALQNYFHFDLPFPLEQAPAIRDAGHFSYKLNAILPDDIVVRRIRLMREDAHCRFDAVSREYNYYIARGKNPFLIDRSYYFPYRLDTGRMQAAAKLLMEYNDFTSFSKRNTQAKTFLCGIEESVWMERRDLLIYKVRANRFLRGMVRALTATMLELGRGKMDLSGFRQIIEAKDCTLASFAAPARGLFLMRVQYPAGYFD